MTASERQAYQRGRRDGTRAAEQRIERQVTFIQAVNSDLIERPLRCKQCGGARLPGHRYCEKCAERRKKITRRQAQSRYWKKQHICQGPD